MKRIKTLCFIMISLLLILLIVGGSLLYFNADATSYLTRAAFSKGGNYELPSSYDEAIEKIQIEQNLSYGQTGELQFDLYYPRDTSKKYPLLIWVHGGAFVGGDKQDCAQYLHMLASEGYVVANMNYPLAPEAIYPAPIKAMGQLSQHLQQLASAYPMDLTSLFIGGDSAGANISAQFVNIQMNDAYATDMNLTPTWNHTQLKGYLSFCGLLDASTYDETDSALSNFLFKQSAISYFDDRQWKDSSAVSQASILNHLTAFPPVYLTDGNKNSFQYQAKKAIQILQEKGIEVTSLFFDQSLPHEYQFQLQTKEAQENYDAVVAFLASHS